MGVLGLLILASGFLAGVLSGGAAGAFSFVLFPLQQLLWATSGLFFANRTLPNFIVATAVGLCLTREFITSARSFAGAWTVTLVASLSLYVWAALTLIWSPSYASGSELMFQGIPYVILMVILVPLAVNGLGQIAALRKGILVFGTATLATISISPEFTYWGGRLVFQFSSEARTNPLALGELGGLMLLAATLDSTERRTLGNRLLRGTAITVGLIGMLQSGSRGQLVGAVLTAIAFIPVARSIVNFRRFATTALVVLTLLVVVPLLASKLLEATALNRWDAADIQGASAGRLENILDIFNVWARNPLAWIIGLGANAFSTVTDAGSEGWIHNLPAEITFEYGAIGVLLFGVAITSAFRDSVWLFGRFREDPSKRADLAFLLGATAFELFLTQKQSHLWGDISLFALMCIISRLRSTEVINDREHSMTADIDLATA
jgi:hypothetical protein